MTFSSTPCKKDEILMFSTGAYSDYGICGVVKFLKDVDLAELVEPFIAYTRLTPKIYGGVAYYDDDGNDFVSWLIKEGYAEVAPVGELHLGSYGKLEF